MKVQPIVYKKQLLVGRMQPCFEIQLRQEVRRMNFSDKLQKIRKENNITQEQLADKLNVSRQAVSKWESGTAYPDTEKLIQISKIFNVSLDELINDKEIHNEKIKKKIDFMEIVNKVIEFISKSISMFFAMKFGEKLKCLFEMIILLLAMVLVAWMCNSIIIEIIRKIFIFLPGNVISVITNITGAFLHIVWIILIVMIFIKIFKTRYLDYYVIITDDSVDKPIIEEPIKELKEKKEYKVVIRDPEHSNFNLLKKIGKIFIFFLKILAICLAIPVIIAFIFLMILFVISMAYLFYGLFFNGITLALLGMLAFTLLIIWFMYNLIFNQKNAYQRMFIVFIISISLIGIGTGISVVSLHDFEIVNDEIAMDKEQIITVSMQDNLIIHDLARLDDSKIVIQEDYEDIKIEARAPENINLDAYAYYLYDEDENEQENRYKVVGITANYDSIKAFNETLKQFKNKKINTYIFNDDEIYKFFSTVKNFYPNCEFKNDILVLCFLLLYCTGMRIGECLSIKFSDIDFKKRTITLYDTKNKEDRNIVINDFLIDKIKYIKNKYKDNYLNEAFIFIRFDGSRHDNRSIYSVFKKVIYYSKIMRDGKSPRVHDFRFTFCCKCYEKLLKLENGKSFIPVLSAYVGHKDFRSTEYYLTLVSELYPDIRQKAENYTKDIIRNMEDFDE